MRKYAAVLIFIFCAAMLTGQDSAMPDTPWFDHVRRPSSLTEAQFCTLASDLRTALKAGQSLDKITALAPEDNSPRVIFITIGGDTWPGRTYFGSGISLKTALRTAVDILLANEPVFARETVKIAKATIEDGIKSGKPAGKEWEERLKEPGAWNWLKLDVVQAARPVPGFSVDRSRIALTSLVGFSFGPEAGFAFTPDQITGRYLLSGTGHIAKQQICNLISETYNWDALKSWMRLSAVDAGHRICLFETDSFYADSQRTVRLYRGHELKKDFPTANEAIAMATAAGDKIADMLDKKTGVLLAPFPAWVTSGQEKESPDAIAECAIALARLSRATKLSKYSTAALDMLKPLMKQFAAYGSDKQYFALIEDEDVGRNTLLVPRKIAALRTNALFCLALLELRNNGMDADSKLLALASRIGLHLKNQAAPGGDFYSAILIPQGTVYTEPGKENFANTEDTALACLALAKLAKTVPALQLGETAAKAADALLENKVIKAPAETLTLSPWLAEALAESTRTDREYVLQMARLGYAAAADMETEPLYPDYYGSVKKYPGCTLSAQRSRLILTLAQWLRKNDKSTWAAEQMSAALPMLMFQTQAWMNEAASAAMPSPAQYRNCFRDNLESFGFDLPGQSAQIISLLLFAEESRHTEIPNKARILEKALTAAAPQDIHPNPLSVNLVLTSTMDSSGDTRELMGGMTQSKQTKIQGKGGRIEKVNKPVSADVKK